MTKALTIVTERVDDIPLLLAQIEGMGSPELLETHFEAHGTGLGRESDGRPLFGWLASCRKGIIG